MKRLFEKSLYVPVVARVCKSTKDLNEIVKEVNEKYKDGKELYRFFEKVFLYGEDTSQWHLSPFGLVYTKGDKYSNRFKGQGMYSLRHVIEDKLEKFHPSIVKEYLEEIYENISLKSVKPFEKYTISNNLVYSIEDGKLKPQKIYIQEDPEGLGFYVCWEGCSRVATHQLVRHQSLDFQQQSQRYINYNKQQSQLVGFYVPSEKCKDPVKMNSYIRKQIRNYLEYEVAIEKGDKPEDARFYLTNAFTSRIIFFVPKERQYGRDGIKEFIEKRSKYAQEEIKNFVLRLKEILYKR